MFLRDFYEESDKANRQQWKVIGLIVLALFAYLAFTIGMFSNQPTQKDIEQTISKSATLRDLDRFGQDIPKPSEFSYRYKKLGGNSRTASSVTGIDQTPSSK